MEREKQKNLKVLSKIIYILAKITKIFMLIGIVSVAFIMCIVPTIFKYLKITENTITVDKEVYDYKIENNQFIVTDEKGKESKYDINTNFDVKEYLKNYNTNDYILHIELLLVSSIIMIVISYLIVNLLEKLFRNIYNDNPFTEENTGYLRNIAKYSLYSFIISMILQIIFSLISNIEIDINFGGTSIMTILILYATTYIFEYGTKLQEKSTEKIYY